MSPINDDIAEILGHESVPGYDATLKRIEVALELVERLGRILPAGMWRAHAEVRASEVLNAYTQAAKSHDHQLGNDGQ